MKTKYPASFIMVVALQSIFHGLRVESSLSSITGIVDSSRLEIEIYSVIQTVKYLMMANQVGNHYLSIRYLLLSLLLVESLYLNESYVSHCSSSCFFHKEAI